MEDIRTIARNAWFQDRERILKDEVLSMNDIADQMIRRAGKENVSDNMAMKLINYLESFESFQELEGYHFYLYDPEDPEIWNEILDHVYRRSITPNYIMN